MSESQPRHEPADEPVDSKFYLPAVAVPPNLGRIEAVVEDLFDFHGVVLIPDSYNE